ncbi:MAG TPA: aldehyde dehydrogenase family protein [Longimicrobiales bacterium]|nr:aldehyde dehydrogenase family protein [Longimicrobiales bacterium]
MKVADIFETLDYGPAPESARAINDWLDAHERRFGLFIDGAWHRPHAGEHFDSIDPAHRTTIARIAQGGAEDIAAAVAAARRALPVWQALGGHGRARFLYAIARHVQKHSRAFAVLESLDNGKPIRESRDIDIPLVARHFYHHAGWAQLMETELAGYEPVGVIGQIIPWNFPLLMLAWKIAPALAMGNTVVLKPAEYTSLTALRFAELCEEIGLPPGVVNIVTGDGRTGQLIVEHDGVDKIAFTGSTEVGRSIRVATAGTGKKLSLELGGKSPFIVFDDADLDSVVEGVVDAIWFNQGQVCCAGSRILVHEGTARRLIDKLRARMERLRVGDPLDKAIDIGAIVAPVQLERIQALVQQGIDEGATIWQPSWSCPEEGCFYPPTLFTDVAPAASIAQVEIFGPVVVLMTFRTHAEAIALANNTRYGLAASVWTENINLALDVAPRLKAGTVWINSTNVFDAASGFGGYRESGFGREGGKEGLYEYVQPSWTAPPAPKGRRETRKPAVKRSDARARALAGNGAPAIDRTAKLYIGGTQARPDSGYSVPVLDRTGRVIAEVGAGNRKDVRNAVEAAHSSGWRAGTAHNRAQVLFYMAENLAARADEFAHRLRAFTKNDDDAATEVERSMERLFLYAGWADKWEGRVHHTLVRMVTLAMREPVGVLGIVCADDAPLLGFISAIAPALALGNDIIVVPSELAPLPATDFYQIADTSDVPAGALSIITGRRGDLVEALAGHDDVDGVWYFAADGRGGDVERLAAANMKRTWIAPARDWHDRRQGAGEEFLRHATEIKNIWVPYGA